MLVVEHTPRVSIAQIQRLAAWPEYKRQRRAAFVFSWDGVNHVAEVALTATALTFGRRWWFRCGCGRRAGFLHLVDGELLCRACGGLLYQAQAWPACAWRREIGRPMLRAMRRARCFSAAGNTTLSPGQT